MPLGGCIEFVAIAAITIVCIIFVNYYIPKVSEYLYFQAFFNTLLLSLSVNVKRGCMQILGSFDPSFKSLHPSKEKQLEFKILPKFAFLKFAFYQIGNENSIFSKAT